MTSLTPSSVTKNILKLFEVSSICWWKWSSHQTSCKYEKDLLFYPQFSTLTYNTLRHFLIKDRHLCFHLHLESMKCLTHLEQVSGPKSMNETLNVIGIEWKLLFFFREVKFYLVSVCHTSIHPSIMQKATKNNHDDILHDLLFVMVCIESHLRHIRIFSWFYEKLLFLWNKSTWDCIRLWAKKFQSCHHLAKQTNLYSKTASNSI